MAFVIQDSRFARFLDIIQLETSLECFINLPVLDEGTSLEDTMADPDLLKSGETLADLEKISGIKRATLLTQLERLKEIGLVANGPLYNNYRRPAPTWGITEYGSQFFSYAKQVKSFFDSKKYSLGEIFRSPRSKGAPPSYVVAEIFLQLFYNPSMLIPEFKQKIIGGVGIEGLVYDGKNIAEETLDHHRKHLKEMGLIEYDEINEKEVRFSYRQDGFSREGLLESRVRYATIVLDFLRKNNEDTYTIEMICKQLNGSLTEPQVREGIKVLANRGNVNSVRSTSSYTPIRLTKKGQELAVVLNKCYSHLNS